MKKIILIEDDSRYHQVVKDICQEIGISFNPETEDDFNTLRSCYTVVLTPPGEYQPDVQEARIKRVNDLLSSYVTEGDDVLYICDYQLREGKREVTGINFYNKFIHEDSPVIIISATTDAEELDLIVNFCEAKLGRAFVPKREDSPRKFKRQLFDLIEAFSQGNGDE